MAATLVLCVVALLRAGPPRDVSFFLLINHKSATNYSVNSLWRRKITVSAQLPR